jgi:DNA gyrase subunit A
LSQRRGGKGVIGAETYEDDFVEHLFTASTHDSILFMTSLGQCHIRKVYEIPEGPRASKGKSVSGLLSLKEVEGIASMICVQAFTDAFHLVMATRNGVVKKSSLDDYANARREGGLRGISLEKGDSLIGCVLTKGDNEIILVSHRGQAVRFEETDLRDQGRDTVGVTGMRFKHPKDYVKAIEICDASMRFLIAREDGIGKRTAFGDYRLTSRGAMGVIAIDLPEDGSICVAGALRVRDSDEVMLLTAKGQGVRTRAKEVRETGRGAKGVRLVDLAPGDRLLAVARVENGGEDEEDKAPAAPAPAV